MILTSSPAVLTPHMLGDVVMSEELLLINKGVITSTQIDALTAISLIEEMTSRIEMFHWCLSNLHSFERNETREFAIGQIHNWIYARWDDIPEGEYSLIVSEMFTNVFADPQYTRKTFRPRIFEIQALVVYELYPNHWPEFFTLLVQFPKDQLYEFLKEFSQLMDPYATARVRDVELIREKTLRDGSQELILQTLLNDVLAGNKYAAEVVADTVEWIDPSLFMTEATLGLFFQMLEHEPAVLHGLKILVRIFKRQMALDFRIEFIQGTELARRLAWVLDNFNTEEICTVVAQMIMVAVQPVIAHEVTIPFIPIAMNLFMLPSLEITTYCKRFLESVFEVAPQTIPSLFDGVLKKIMGTIGLADESADQILVYALSLLFTAARRTQEDVIPYLVSLTGGMDMCKSPLEVATLLASLKTILEDEELTEIRVALADLFSPIFSIEPPYHAAHFIALSNYAQIVETCMQMINPIHIAGLFCQTLRFIDGNLGKNVFERASLMEIIRSICQKYAGLIIQLPNIENIVLGLIGSREKDLLAAAAWLLTEVPPEQRMAVYHGSLPLLDEMAQAGIVRNAIDFIIPMNLDGCDAFIPEMIQFMGHLSQFCLQSASLFSSFVEAAVKSIGLNGFELLWGYRQALATPENAIFVIECAKGLADLAGPDARIGQLVVLITETISSCSTGSTDLPWKVNTDELNTMQSFCKAVIDFLPPVIGNVPVEVLPMAVQSLNFAFFGQSIPYKPMELCIDAYSQLPMELIHDRFQGFYEKYISLIRMLQYAKDEIEEISSLLYKITRLMRELHRFGPVENLASTEWDNIMLKTMRESGLMMTATLLNCPDEDFDAAFAEMIRVASVRSEEDWADATDDEEEEWE